jgi:hypothetical protein
MTENTKQYYIFSKKKRMGPYTISEIVDKTTKGLLTPNDLIIKSGMKEWVRLDKFDDVSELFRDQNKKQKSVLDKFSNLSKKSNEFVNKIKKSDSLISSFEGKKNIAIEKLEKLGDKEKVESIINKSRQLVEKRMPKSEHINQLKVWLTSASSKFPFGAIGLLTCIFLFLTIIPLAFLFLSDDAESLKTGVQRNWQPENFVKSMEGSNWINISNEESFRFKKISFSDKYATVLSHDGEENKFELTRLFGAEDFSSEMTEDFILFRLYSDYETTRTYQVIKKDKVPLTGDPADIINFGLMKKEFDDEYYYLSENHFRTNVKNAFGRFHYLLVEFSTKKRKETGVWDEFCIATNSLLILDPKSIKPEFFIPED